MGTFERVRDDRETVRAVYAHHENYLLHGLFLQRLRTGNPLPSGIVGGGGR